MGMSGGVTVKMEKVDPVDLLDYDPSCTHKQQEQPDYLLCLIHNCMNTRSTIHRKRAQGQVREHLYSAECVVPLLCKTMPRLQEFWVDLSQIPVL